MRKWRGWAREDACLRNIFAGSKARISWRRRLHRFRCYSKEKTLRRDYVGTNDRRLIRNSDQAFERTGEAFCVLFTTPNRFWYAICCSCFRSFSMSLFTVNILLSFPDRFSFASACPRWGTRIRSCWRREHQRRQQARGCIGRSTQVLSPKRFSPYVAASKVSQSDSYSIWACDKRSISSEVLQILRDDVTPHSAPFSAQCVIGPETCSPSASFDPPSSRAIGREFDGTVVQDRAHLCVSIKYIGAIWCPRITSMHFSFRILSLSRFFLFLLLLDLNSDAFKPSSLRSGWFGNQMGSCKDLGGPVLSPLCCALGACQSHSG